MIGVDLSPEVTVAVIGLLGIAIGVWVRVNSALKVMEARVNLLEDMVKDQNSTTRSMLEALNQVNVSVARIETKIDSNASN